MTIDKYTNDFIKAIKATEFYIGNKKFDENKWIENVAKIIHAHDKIFLIGNGASSSMASHYSTDMVKNLNIDAESLNEGALLTCFSNDYGYENNYKEILKRKWNRDYGNILIAISSSGNSPNIINGVDYVKNESGYGLVVTFSGFNKDNKLKALGDYSCYVPYTGYGIVESIHNYFIHKLIDYCIENK